MSAALAQFELESHLSLVAEHAEHGFVAGYFAARGDQVRAACSVNKQHVGGRMDDAALDVFAAPFETDAPASSKRFFASGVLFTGAFFGIGFVPRWRAGGVARTGR